MATASQHDQNAINESELLGRLDAVRRRLFSVGIVAAFGWMMLAVIVVLSLAVWFDLLWELPSSARFASFAVAALVGVVLFGSLLGSLFRKSSRQWLASELDKVGNTGGEIASGLDLSNSMTGGKSRILADGVDASMEAGLASMAISRAGECASHIDRSLVIPARPIKIVAIILAVVAVSFAAIGLSTPKLVRTQWSRFVNPTEDVPPFSLIEFEITPGNIDLKYGDGVDIVANLNSTPIDELQLVIKSQTNLEKPEDIVPMFSEGKNQWRATLFRVTESLEYEIRAGRARSEKYSINMLLVPEFKEAQFRVSPPAYTRLGTTVVPANDGVQGLVGTRVEVICASNRPLSVGRMAMTGKGESVTIDLLPRPGDATEVVGEFTIQHAGKFEIQLVDESGIESTQIVSGTISVVEDTRPFVRLISPKQNSLATATVNLPIAIDAEDDYGISSLSLYRSLNDSRPMPVKIEITNQPSRHNARMFLPLTEYDLKPGDKLELFARVVDNDPLKAKGSESPIHVVQIISREQFEQMNRERLGIESVLKKYRQIQRRLEALEQMQREIEAMDAEGAEPGDQPSEPKRQKMAEVAQEFKKSAKEMQRLLEQRFPVDFDRDLESRIDEMSDQMLEISREIRDLIDEIEENEIDNEQLKLRLEELRAKLAGIRDDFQKQVMEPLGKLSKIFKLMSKQQEFVQIVLRQRNLADRLKSLDGVDDEDDPDLKRRMRDLSEEQRSLRDWLDDLLFEIENEAYSLPTDDEFNELRDSALAFVVDVTDSGAMDEQEDAETGLAEFSGTDGYRHAVAAAVALETLIDQSNEMGEQGEAGAQNLFKPNFGHPKLGNSLKQLSDLFGPKNGMRQQGSSNRGLYGDQPMSERRESAGQGEDQRGGGGFYSGAPSGETAPGNEINRTGGNTGSAQITVPPRYQRKVSDYYRRIVEELGDQ